MKGDIYKSALLAGLISGLLSGLPILSLGNCLCCLWIVGGGVLGTYFYQKSSSIKLDAGDGLSVGALTGAMAAMVATPLDLIFSYWSRQFIIRFLEAYGENPRVFEQYFTVGSFAVNFMMRILIFALFSAIGGAIGTGIFKPKTDSNS